jgi:hypothetical protein
MPGDFTLTCHDPIRAAEWRETFGTESLPVRSPVPELARLPGFDLPQRVYLLDWASLSEHQQTAAVRAVAAKWGIPAWEVRRDIDRDGFPLLADGCSLMVTNPARWV